MLNSIKEVGGGNGTSNDFATNHDDNKSDIQRHDEIGFQSMENRSVATAEAILMKPKDTMPV